MSELRILLRDTQTGKEAWHSEQADPNNLDGLNFYWTEGNMACDCNRLLTLCRALGEPDQDIECGSSRVRIVEATLYGVLLMDWIDAPCARFQQCDPVLRDGEACVCARCGFNESEHK